MKKQQLSNPKNFVSMAKKLNVYNDFLVDGVNCIGKQSVCRMFNGKSRRGGINVISDATLQKWIDTFKYVEEHPDEEDNDSYQARGISPMKEWNDYVELIKTPISEDVYNKWKKLSTKQLGDEAIKHGFTLGIRNGKSVKTLHPRMMKMIERRKEIWNKTYITLVEEKVNYKLNNVPQLKKICKKRNITSSRLNKQQIIDKLIEWDKNPPQITHSLGKYDRLNVKTLKKICKDRGLSNYNRQLKPQLIEMIEKDDNKDEDEIEREKINSNILVKQLTNKNNIQFNIEIRKSDGYVNATKLCNAGGKEFKHYKENKQTQMFLKELKSNVGIPTLNLIDVKVGGNHLGSWVHRKVAYHMAQWISPKFAVQVTNILDELFMTGEVKLERPTKLLQDLDNLNIEAEILEQKCDILNYTNKCCLYMAYIGDGLIKVGYTDCRLMKRIDKHLSSTESNYKQFRMIKIFQISSRTIENKVHNLLTIYREVFHREKEVYKPPESLEKFINLVENILQEEDLKLQLDLAREEIQRLKLENAEMKIKLLEMKN